MGIETMRRWMKAEGLWIDRKNQKKRVYQPRYRRECFGELVQIDGSEHWWFEDRGPQCTLLVYIDDATSRLMQLKLVESESAFAYFASTREYLERHGKPVAFYSDKHSIFRVTRKGAVGGNGMTQFGRSLHDLNIDIICADTPQAKGRVERANRTLQDRLVKELRLTGVGDIASANEMLPAFMEDYNARFAKLPRNAKDLHRPLLPDENLDDAFAWREDRTVSASLTVQYDKMLFILEPNDFSRGLVRKRVTISDYQDGRLIIAHNGRPLAYSIFDKVRQVNLAAIVDNKSLSAVLMKIREEQLQRPQKRSGKAPRRHSQENSIFNAPAIAAPNPPPVRQPQDGQPYTTPGYKRRITKPGEVIRPSAQPPAEPPLLGDRPIAKVHADFRCFNRYVVQKRRKKPAPKTRWKQAAPQLRHQPPNLARRPRSSTNTAAADFVSERLGAALALARDYKKAA